MDFVERLASVAVGAGDWVQEVRRGPIQNRPATCRPRRTTGKAHRTGQNHYREAILGGVRRRAVGQADSPESDRGRSDGRLRQRAAARSQLGLDRNRPFRRLECELGVGVGARRVRPGAVAAKSLSIREFELFLLPL